MLTVVYIYEQNHYGMKTMQFAYLKRYTNFGKKKLYFEVRHHQCLTEKDISQHTLRQAALNLNNKKQPLLLTVQQRFLL